MDEELQISISQYSEGSLSDAERAAVEAILADDVAAQTLLADDRALTTLLRSSKVPDVQWDLLAHSISLAIDDQLQESVGRASWWLRMRMPAGITALAASVVVIIGLSLHWFSKPSATRPGNAPNSVALVAQSGLYVQGPAEDLPAGPAVSEVTISAGGAYAKDSSLTPYAEDIDSRPGRVVIASGLTPQSGTLPFPY